MESLIQILHLEDDPADAELVQARLVEAGLACRIKGAHETLGRSVGRSQEAWSADLRGAV
jgi:hypothetical protein